jgi:flagella basal body P-ring formation protein FlgA
MKFAIKLMSVLDKHKRFYQYEFAQLIASRITLRSIRAKVIGFVIKRSPDAAKRNPVSYELCEFIQVKNYGLSRSVFKLAFMIAFLSDQVNAQTMLRFQPHITTQAKYLSDVLLISQDKNNLKTLKLDSKPKGGGVLSKQQILTWIKDKTGLIDYQWQGKNTAVIEQNSQTSGEELLKKAQQSLAEYLKKQSYDSIQLTAKNKPKDSEFALADFTIELPKNNPPAKEMCVRLNYKNHSIPIWFTVKAYQKVLVAKHALKNRSPVNKEDFILKQRNIAGLKNAPYSQLPSTQWLKNSINKNHILTTNDLINLPQVIRGQLIKIKIVNGGISILTEAIAENDGYLGQTIQLKNTKTNKHFEARVTGPNQAEVSV